MLIFLCFYFSTSFFEFNEDMLDILSLEECLDTDEEIYVNCGNKYTKKKEKKIISVNNEPKWQKKKKNKQKRKKNNEPSLR